MVRVSDNGENGKLMGKTMVRISMRILKSTVMIRVTGDGGNYGSGDRDGEIHG
jgi:hypothetical protein